MGGPSLTIEWQGEGRQTSLKGINRRTQSQEDKHVGGHPSLRGERAERGREEKRRKLSIKENRSHPLRSTRKKSRKRGEELGGGGEPKGGG